MKNIFVTILILTTLMTTASASACHSNYLLSGMQSNDADPTCNITVIESLENHPLISKIDQNSELVFSDKSAMSRQSWFDWSGGQYDDPIISGKVQNGLIGLGFWLPEQLTETDVEMSYSEWLISHGLQLSLAYGADDNQGTRIRMDYRWHDEYQGNIMFQLEWPF